MTEPGIGIMSPIFPLSSPCSERFFSAKSFNNRNFVTEFNCLIGGAIVTVFERRPGKAAYLGH
jgi:hypothetical protein